MMPEKNLGLWDHIEDLRSLILSMVFVILIGFVCVFYFHQEILNFLIKTRQNTSTELTEQEIKFKRILNQSSKTLELTLPTNAQVYKEYKSQKNTENPRLYLIESLGYVDYSLTGNPRLLLLSPLEGLLQTFKVSFWLSFAMTSPIWCLFLFKFVAPGLHEHEKKLFIPFIFFSIFCAGLGIVFAHFFTIPMANHYLTEFNAVIGQNAWALGHYIDYTLVIYFGHIIACELCLLLFLLVHFRILSSDRLIAMRRYMIVAAFVLAAILTPPDMLTQFALAIPLLGFYELAIFYGKYRKLIA